MKTEHLPPHDHARRCAQDARVTRPQRKSYTLPAVLCALFVLAAAAVFILYVVPLFIPHPVDPHEHMALNPPSSQVSDTSVQSGSTDVTPDGAEDNGGGASSAPEVSGAFTQQAL